MFVVHLLKSSQNKIHKILPQSVISCRLSKFHNYKLYDILRTGQLIIAHIAMTNLLSVNNSASLNLRDNKRFSITTGYIISFIHINGWVQWQEIKSLGAFALVKCVIRSPYLISLLDVLGFLLKNGIFLYDVRTFVLSFQIRTNKRR